jgi:hypothetical protein
VVIWRDYFLRWVEDPLRGYPPALKAEQRRFLAKKQKLKEAGKLDPDEPNWPAIFDEVGYVA